MIKEGFYRLPIGIGGPASWEMECGKCKHSNHYVVGCNRWQPKEEFGLAHCISCECKTFYPKSNLIHLAIQHEIKSQDRIGKKGS